MEYERRNYLYEEEENQPKVTVDNGGILRKISIGTYFLFLVFGLAFLGIGGFAVGTDLAELLPKHFPAAGIFIVGMSLIVVAILGILACWKINRYLLIFATILLVALVCTQAGLAIEAVHMGGLWSQELYNSWNQSSLDVRIQIEKEFNCCGYQSKEDEIPPDWNIKTCSENIGQCCVLPKAFNVSSANTTVFHSDPNSFCNSNDTLLECCGAPDVCVNGNDTTCENALSAFINRKLKVIEGVGIFFALLEFIGVIESILLLAKIWPRKTEPKPYARYSRL